MSDLHFKNKKELIEFVDKNFSNKDTIKNQRLILDLLVGTLDYVSRISNYLESKK